MGKVMADNALRNFSLKNCKEMGHCPEKDVELRDVLF